MKSIRAIAGLFLALCAGSGCAASQMSPSQSNSEIDAVSNCVDRSIPESVGSWLRFGIAGYGDRERFSDEDLKEVLATTPEEIKQAMSSAARATLANENHSSKVSYDRLYGQLMEEFVLTSPRILGVAHCGSQRAVGEVVAAKVVDTFGSALYPGFRNGKLGKKLMAVHGSEATYYFGNLLFFAAAMDLGGSGPSFGELRDKYRPSHESGLMFAH